MKEGEEEEGKNQPAGLCHLSDVLVVPELAAAGRDKDDEAEEGQEDAGGEHLPCGFGFLLAARETRGGTTTKREGQKKKWRGRERDEFSGPQTFQRVEFLFDLSTEKSQTQRQHNSNIPPS